MGRFSAGYFFKFLCQLEEFFFDGAMFRFNLFQLTVSYYYLFLKPGEKFLQIGEFGLNFGEPFSNRPIRHVIIIAGFCHFSKKHDESVRRHSAYKAVCLQIHPAPFGYFHSLSPEERHLQLSAFPGGEGNIAVCPDDPVPGQIQGLGQGMEYAYHLPGAVAQARSPGHITVR
jgi:hypothetical protein